MALDLHLDPAIRTWVFLPIVVIVFTVSIIRHYAVLLFRGETKATIEKIQENQYLTKSRLLRANGHLLPGKSFQMRQKFHTDEESGFIASRRQAPKENVSMSPDMLSQQLTGQLLNTIPTILIGTWINYTFSGFVTTRMPFPLTRNFTVMLQRGVNLTSLDASWVSSHSWYFLNVFGLRSVCSLVLGEENAADSVKAMEEQMKMSASMMPADQNSAFRAEWEALNTYTHKFVCGQKSISKSK